MPDYPRQGFDPCHVFSISQFQLSSVILFCIVDKTFEVRQIEENEYSPSFYDFLELAQEL